MGEHETGRNWVLSTARVLAVVVTCLVLAATGYLLYKENTWATPELRTPENAFTDGSIGTEIVPLPVMQVLPELVKDKNHFTPRGPDAGDWIEQFGFLRARPGHPPELPNGFTLSNYRPKSGAPSPVPFVGIGCATCHSSEIIRPDGTTFYVLGSGNTSLNLFAWLDAFQAAMLEDAVTPEAIADAYRAKYQKDLSLEESMMVRLWLSGFRKTLQENETRFDAPYGGESSLDPEVTPTGPGRTQPFRTLVRTVMHRPGATMKVFTKVMPVYHGNWQEWVQVDGGIRGLDSRSALAVLAAGATLDNLRVPEIGQNVRKATEFIGTLSGPKFANVFLDETKHIDEEAVTRGNKVYDAHCFKCHGRPGNKPGTWEKGPDQGNILPYEKIGTDSERVTFRYYDELPDKIWETFPADHPFKFPREDLRPGPLGKVKGYVGKPLDSAFSRVPYLHNASVLTMAALINLEPRQPVFYRGRNRYDPKTLGLVSPKGPDKDNYFKFDTSLQGNSNKGHDYPWRYTDGERNEPQLRDLLEYLKTL